MFLLRCGFRFSFWSMEVPEPRVRKGPFHILKSEKKGLNFLERHGPILRLTFSKSFWFFGFCEIFGILGSFFRFDESSGPMCPPSPRFEHLGCNFFYWLLPKARKRYCDKNRQNDFLNMGLKSLPLAAYMQKAGDTCDISPQFFLDFPQNFRLRTRNQYCTQAIAWGSTI